VGAAKVNDSLEMRFRRRMGAGGEGKKNFGDGIPAKDGCWRRRKKNYLEKEFRRRMGAEARCGCGEGK